MKPHNQIKRDMLFQHYMISTEIIRLEKLAENGYDVSDIAENLMTLIDAELHKTVRNLHPSFLKEATPKFKNTMESLESDYERKKHWLKRFVNPKTKEI